MSATSVFLSLQAFKFPNVLPIWLEYLKKFVARYGDKKVERARDLFEQAIEKVSGIGICVYFPEMAPTLILFMIYETACAG